ncbi:hypothetical protein EDS67_19980, partial [candidate division KSB1 bacterium]
SSIFQSEILISEENFVKHFPGQSGYSYFLLEAPLAQAQALAQALERDLSDYGFDATLTSEKLAGFQVVENTYLSVFQTLGGLGLLLGTLGLGIILLRNVIERRGELATLRAFGFREATLRHMLCSARHCSASCRQRRASSLVLACIDVAGRVRQRHICQPGGGPFLGAHSVAACAESGVKNLLTVFA